MAGNVHNVESGTEINSKRAHQVRTDEENSDKYGCFSCHPPGQALLTSGRFFLLIMCVLIFSDAFNIGTLSGALTSLETRYELKASELGLIESLYEAGNLIFVIFIVHFVGRQEHRRPLWIGLGALTMALGTAIAFSPQFIFSAYEPDWRSISTNQTADPLICAPGWLSESAVEQCESGDQQEIRRESRMAYVIVLCGEILVGIGWTPVMPLSMSYIDDNVNTKTSAMFIGIIQSMFGIGTIIGFLASAAVATKWVDFYLVDTDAVELSPDDNLWVGAWWLGLAITSSLYFMSSLPFFGFPRRLRSRPSADIKVDDNFMLESSTTDEPDREDLVDPGSTSKGVLSLLALPVALWRLLCNPIFIWLNVGNVSEMAVIAGLVTFFPKYLETQFGLSPPEANFFMAVIPVPAVALGSIIGGFALKRFDLKAEGAIKLALACSVISLVGQVALLGVGCDDIGFAGVDVAYPDDSRDLTIVNLTSSCNKNCSCNSMDPEIVCGVDGITYYSACHAGCKENINGTYFNCSCVYDPTGQNGPVAGSVQPGACPMSNCNTLAPFLAIMFVIALFSSCEEIPQLIVLMRCVKKTDKSLALGMRHVFNRIFGNIPAPLYYGAVIDGTCRIWQQFCGEKGECWAYSLPSFRYGFMGVTVALKIISASSYFMTWMLLKRKAGDLKMRSAEEETGSSERVGVNWEAMPGGLGEIGFGAASETSSVEKE